MSGSGDDDDHLDIVCASRWIQFKQYGFLLQFLVKYMSWETNVWQMGKQSRLFFFSSIESVSFCQLWDGDKDMWP